MNFYLKMIQYIVTPTNHVIARAGLIYIARDTWHLGDFFNIFLPNIDEDQKSLTI